MFDEKLDNLLSEAHSNQTIARDIFNILDDGNTGFLSLRKIPKLLDVLPAEQEHPVYISAVDQVSTNSNRMLVSEDDFIIIYNALLLVRSLFDPEHDDQVLLDTISFYKKVDSKNSNIFIW